jgi:hypothetical protein
MLASLPRVDTAVSNPSAVRKAAALRRERYRGKGHSLVYDFASLRGFRVPALTPVVYLIIRSFGVRDAASPAVATDAARSASSFRRSAAKWMQRLDVWMFACPIAAWISGPEAPPMARWLATEWRRPCRVNAAGNAGKARCSLDAAPGALQVDPGAIFGRLDDEAVTHSRRHPLEDIPRHGG